MLRNGILFGLLAGLGANFCAGQDAPATNPAAPPPTPTTIPSAAPALVVPEGTSTEQILAMARQAQAAGQYKQVEQLLDLVIRQDPRNFEANMMLAQIAEDRNDLETARYIYKKLKPLYPNEFRVDLGLGRVYVTIEYWRPAVAFLESAERIAPPDRKGETLSLLALAYRGQGTLTKALDTAEKAIALQPNDYRTRKTLLMVRVDAQKFDQAFKDAELLVQTAEQQVREKPSDFGLLRQLFDAYDTQLKLLRSYHVSFYQRNAAGQPTDQLLPGKEAEAANTLKQITDLAIAQSDLQRTMTYFNILPLAEKAVEYEPNNPKYLLSLGVLLRNTSQFARAVETFQKVLEKEPGNPDAARHLQELNAPQTSQPTAAAGPATP